jgi:hypothetical protein
MLINTHKMGTEWTHDWCWIWCSLFPSFITKTNYQLKGVGRNIQHTKPVSKCKCIRLANQFMSKPQIWGVIFHDNQSFFMGILKWLMSISWDPDLTCTGPGRWTWGYEHFTAEEVLRSGLWSWIKPTKTGGIVITIWLFKIAMEHGPFIDGLPIKNGDFPWLC